MMSSSIISQSNYEPLCPFHLKALETQSYNGVVSEMKPVGCCFKRLNSRARENILRMLQQVEENFSSYQRIVMKPLS